MATKVLIVSAGPGFKAELTSILEGCDCAILHATSAKAAHTAIASDPDIGLILLEAAGKAEGSLEFFRHFKHDRRRAMIPVAAAGHGFEAETVKAFIELHIDDIIALPVDAETMQARLRSLAEEKRPTILVVDDDTNIREFLTDLLETERFQTLAAESVDQAIDVLARNRVDVVVSDIVMPHKSGYELLVYVKDKYPAIPVVMITGFSGKYSPIDIIAAGADGYFTKPFHNNELTATLRGILAKRKSDHSNPRQHHPQTVSS
ncbi:MAG: response regulator [candidate division Zixibacteria bacterium]|nr:response regulator [candidate division Zixibacteria bacterium]